MSGLTQNLLDQVNQAMSLFAMRGVHMKQASSDWDQTTASPAQTRHGYGKPAKRKWPAAEWEEYEKSKRAKYANSQDASNAPSSSGANNQPSNTSQPQAGTGGCQFQTRSPISVLLSITGKGVVREEQKAQYLNSPDGEGLIACLPNQDARLAFTSQTRCVFRERKRNREQVPGKACHFRHEGSGLRAAFPLREPLPETLRLFRGYKQLPK